METNFIDVEPVKNPQPFTWSKLNRLRAADAVKVLNGVMRGYWPVGVRGVYYQVVSLPGFRDAPHWRSQKGKTTGEPLAKTVDAVQKLLKWCRLDAPADLSIPMSSINDEGRQIGGKVGFSSNAAFFDQQICGVFNGFSNCLAQNQERYIEV